MCKYFNYGVRYVDKLSGEIKVQFMGRYLGSVSSDNIGDSIGQIVLIPCGQCMECRIAKARDWSIRLVHESYMHTASSFLTLTYDDEHLEDGSLKYGDLQIFMKKLRRQLDYHFGKKVRFYGVGEYGSKSLRPHFHIILFGEDFSFDRRKWSKAHGFQYYRSDFLESIWNKGFSIIGDVSYDSVNYVARYTTKKISGKLAEFIYDGLEPEKALMSRRPGIGKSFLVKYSGDIYNFDKVILRNIKAKPPAYYDKIFSVLHPDEFQQIKEKRSADAIERRKELLNRFSVDGIYKAALEEKYYYAIEAKTSELIKRKRGFETL